MAIYTKVGDKGKTSLLNKKRVWKNSSRVNAYGTIDELNCFFGIICVEIGKPNPIKSDSKKAYKKYLLNIILQIQQDLFSIGSYLANPGKEINIDLKRKTTDFEQKIDEMTKMLPPLVNFIIPGGGKVGAMLQYSRTIARRAERIIVKLHKDESLDENLLAYINRMSDLLFTMSRFANYKEKKKETIWSSKK